MSEQILDRPTTPGAPVLPGMEPLEEEPSARNRTRAIVAVAVLVGIVVGGMVLLMLRPGPAEQVVDRAIAGAAVEAAIAAQAEAAAEAAAAEEVTTTRTKVKITSRDPFAPLVPKAPPPPAPKAAAEPAAGVSASSGVTISALKVSTNGASVTLKLDGEKYSVDEGEAFAKNYRLYDIFNDNCAGFLYGDQNAVVCEGDSVTLG